MTRACSKKMIWVTGASSGIGRALAVALINEGHCLIVSGRRRDPLLQLQKSAPERVSIIDFDLADQAQTLMLSARLREITDSVDLVILAAGTCEYVDSPDVNTALYRRVIETNFFAQVQCVLAALPLLRRSEQRAQIVGIGSLAAMLPFPRAQAYGASKAAFEYWLDCMRIDLAPENIDVSVVSPGFVDTPLTRKNDFAMPTLISLDQATGEILRGVQARKQHIRFPRRLHWGLSVLAVFEGLWFRQIAPRLSRSQKL